MRVLKKGIIRFYIFQSLLFLASVNSFSQKADSATGFISYSQKLGVYFYGISKFSNFQIEGTELNKSIDYSPNNNFNLGAGFNYKWIAFAFAFNFKFINNNDKELYGDTKSSDIQIETFMKKYLVSGNFQVYKGYYWKNPDDFYTNWSKKDSLIIKPKLSTVNFALDVIHIFNYESFSLKAAYIGTERQLVSSGSWLVGAKASIYGAADDSTLVPEILTGYYPEASRIAQLTAINVGGALGYSHTFVFKKYYFTNITFMLGVNVQGVGVNSSSGENLGIDSKIGSNAYLRFAIGCNKEKKYYGISVNIESYVVRNPNETQLTYDYGKLKLYYGKRFNLRMKGNKKEK